MLVSRGTNIPEAGLATVGLMMRERVIGRRFCAVHVILHLIPVADVISTLAVATRAKKVGSE